MITRNIGQTAFMVEFLIILATAGLGFTAPEAQTVYPPLEAASTLFTSLLQAFIPVFSLKPSEEMQAPVNS